MGYSGVIGRSESAKRKYYESKRLGLCVKKGCLKKARKDRIYCLKHKKLDAIHKKTYREKMEKLKLVKPMGEGFNGKDVRCARCKKFYLLKEGHDCPEKF